MSTTPRALAWFGGKSTHNTSGLGRWVLGLLPPVVPNQTYVEPYAGMLSVLLARERAACEAVNDLDGRVYNFWRVLRDQPDELERLLAATPHSRQTHTEARDVLAAAQQHSEVKQAWALVVAVGQGIMAKATADVGWANSANGSVKQSEALLSRAHRWRNVCANVTSAALRDRIREVTLECRDGAAVAKYYAGTAGAVIYCDPPYSDGAYGYTATADQSALIAAVCDAQARVAISGYGSDPYDELGWHRYERPTKVQVAQAGWQAVTDRTEVLWCNYDAATDGAAGQQVLL